MLRKVYPLLSCCFLIINGIVDYWGLSDLLPTLDPLPARLFPLFSSR